MTAQVQRQHRRRCLPGYAAIDSSLSLLTHERMPPQSTD
jgi:hypothetical protein